MKYLLILLTIYVITLLSCTKGVRDEFPEHSRLDIWDIVEAESNNTSMQLELMLKEAGCISLYQRYALIYYETENDKYRLLANKYLDSARIYNRDGRLLR